MLFNIRIYFVTQVCFGKIIIRIYVLPLIGMWYFEMFLSPTEDTRIKSDGKLMRIIGTYLGVKKQLPTSMHYTGFYVTNWENHDKLHLDKQCSERDSNSGSRIRITGSIHSTVTFGNWCVLHENVFDITFHRSYRIKFEKKKEYYNKAVFLIKRPQLQKLF
jgi:hypothetical protein